jgi:hypothetical protein
LLYWEATQQEGTNAAGVANKKDRNNFPGLPELKNEPPRDDFFLWKDE